MLQLFKHKKTGEYLFVMFNIVTTVTGEYKYQALFDNYKPFSTTAKNLKVNYDFICNPTGKALNQYNYIKSTL